MEAIINRSYVGTVSSYHLIGEIFVNGENLLCITATAFTPTGSILVPETPITPEPDGEMRLLIPAEATTTAYEWCRAHFRYTYDGREYTQDVYFHIARGDFDIPFHYDELTRLQPDIGDYAWSGDAKFSKQREAARDELYARLVNAGRRPWAILNRSSLAIPFAWLWLAIIHHGLSRTPDDVWWRRGADCREKFETAFTAVNLIEAQDDSADVNRQPSVPLGRTKLKRG